ncbi:MAG: Lrp/AsnC family transcriptional regulator [Candidatus Woesearchaeota archaeon]|jgi:DNA-binding Lrp family transcriptional regulator
MNLTLNDKKILYVLNVDSSLSIVAIEKITKIPRNVITNRLKKLEISKIIKAYKLNINYKLLGFEEFEVYLRLMGNDNKKKKELIQKLTEHKNISWIGTCFGNYDLKLSLYAKNNQELYSILLDALNGYKEYIKAQEIVSVTRKYKMDKSLFLSTILKEQINFDINKSINSKITIEQSNKQHDKEKQNNKQNKAQKIENKLKLNYKTEQLDSVDKTLILELSKNPRSKLITLANATNLSIQGVKNRITSLQKRQIIFGSSALINGQILNNIWATCLFKLTLDESQEILLEKYILTMSGTTSAVRLIGRWDLGITFFSISIDDLQTKINDFKAAFKDQIKDYDSLIILENFKYPKLPQCVLE